MEERWLGNRSLSIVVPYPQGTSVPPDLVASSEVPVEATLPRMTSAPADTIEDSSSLPRATIISGKSAVTVERKGLMIRNAGTCTLVPAKESECTRLEWKEVESYVEAISLVRRRVEQCSGLLTHNKHSLLCLVSMCSSD